jgi:hypothetical protein
MSIQSYSMKRSSARLGAVTVLVAICLTLMIGFAALTIDMGLKYVWVTEMQQACDASALAGASALHKSDDTAKVRAVDLAGRNLVNQSDVKPSEIRPVLGNWSGVRHAFTPATGTGGHTPNAIRVVGQRDGIPFYFAAALGKNTTTVRRDAVAIGGGKVCAGIWGLEGITAAGNLVTDSYVSRDGPYGPGNMRPNGDICSCSDISLNGGVEIHGDAMYGEDDSLILRGDSNEVWGVIGPHVADVEAPLINMATVYASNDNKRIPLTANGKSPFKKGSGFNLYIGANDNVTLPGGRFYLTSATVLGQGYITVTAHTEIYIDGSASFGGGGIVNATQDPRNLIIYSMGSSLKVSGASAFYGTMVAPRADIEMMGDSVIYGTVLGRTVGFTGNAVVHVDEGLVRDLFGINPIIPILVK